MNPQKYLTELKLHRLGPSEPAGLWVTSLPWPRAAKPADIALAGRPTSITPLGQWPGEPEGTPRRLFLAADGGDAPAPELVSFSGAVKTNAAAPTAEMESFARSPDEGYVWERHMLRLRWGGRTVGIAMGLRHNGEVHWWEACRLVVLDETPACRTIEMGGAIPRIATTFEQLRQYKGYNNPFLHHHNWLNGHIHARLHANGVCEIFAHHINAKFFDDGEHLEDVVPVIGIWEVPSPSSSPKSQVPSPGEATCDGSQTSLTVGDAAFDFTEVARLATPEQPGRLDRDGNWVVLQPYMGVQMFGGICPIDIIGDAYIYRAQKKTFPRGVARTLRFSLSLNPKRSPRIARYLAPAWWYGVCEEFMPAPLLPVANEYDKVLDRVRRAGNAAILKGGFEDGSMPRGGSAQGDKTDIKRYEPGWEGELPQAQFLQAWRTGNTEDYENAMRSAWHFTDVVVDHAAKLVRMHGFPPHAFALPMARVQACVAAYLETGDPYCLDTAEAVIETSYRLQKNSWPRLAVGRDACFVRGAVMLYRYTGNDHFRRIAHDGAMQVAHSQKPNGSFGDQGGGTGIHQWGGYITKPWMGLLATGGVLDYLEMFPEDGPLLACAKRFADWLMSNRLDRGGVKTWAYQHDTDGKPRHLDFYSGKFVDLPSPNRWHQDNIGRLMMICAQRFGDTAYIDAWAESFAPSMQPKKDELAFGDHGASATMQFLPWVQARLWNATLREDAIEVSPVHFGARTPAEGRVMGPRGEVVVKWKDENAVELPAGVVRGT